MRKIITLIIPAVMMIAALGGCSSERHQWVVKIEDEPISPQEYVAAQMHSYLEATMMADTVSEDILRGSIDDVSAHQWIEERTIANLKELCVLEEEFAARGLEIEAEVMEYLEAFCQEGWENVSVLYGNNGLDADHYMRYLVNLYKKQMVFNDMYMSDKEGAVTDRQVMDYLSRNLCRLSYFKIPKVNDDGTRLSFRQQTQLTEIVNKAVETVNKTGRLADTAGRYLTQAAKLLGSTVDFSQGADFVTTEYISASTTTLSSEDIVRIFSRQVGGCGYFETADSYYIYQKQAVYETESEYLSFKQDIVNLLKDAEFQAYLAQKCADMAVEVNREAVAYYTPDKIKITF